MQSHSTQIWTPFCCAACGCEVLPVYVQQLLTLSVLKPVQSGRPGQVLLAVSLRINPSPSRTVFVYILCVIVLGLF